LNVPSAVIAIEGGREVERDGRLMTVEVAVPDGPMEWVDCRLVVRLGAGLGQAPRTGRQSCAAGNTGKETQ
jgi:hypothetical protein